MPTKPPEVMRSRSAPLVLAVMTFVPVAESARLPALVTIGVVTVVKVPAAAVVPPMTVLLMVPPPMATLLVWNWPAPVMMARTRPPVANRRSTGVAVSLVPM